MVLSMPSAATRQIFVRADYACRPPFPLIECKESKNKLSGKRKYFEGTLAFNESLRWERKQNETRIKSEARGPLGDRRFGHPRVYYAAARVCGGESDSLHAGYAKRRVCFRCDRVRHR